MLPASVRMRRPDDFAQTIRAGVRAGAPHLVVHLRVVEPPRGADRFVGLVVSRAVGTAVVRTRVKRRLRHQASARLAGLPDGCRVVVRALPSASEATSAELGRDLDGALATAVRAQRRRATTPSATTPSATTPSATTPPGATP